MRTYDKYWGKSDRNSDQPDYHLLAYHSLDVAAVGYTLMHSNPVYLNHFLRLTGLDRHDFVPWFTFLLALHDMGKFADGFQNLNPIVLQELQKRSSQRGYHARHDSLGWMCWQNVLRPDFIRKHLIRVSGSPHRQKVDQAIDIWISAMVGHHGQPPNRTFSHSEESYFEVPADYSALTEFATDLIPLLLGEQCAFPSCEIETLRVASWWIAGAAVLCDWLGSNTQYFPYRNNKISLPKYWEYAKLQAAKIIQQTQLSAAKPASSLGLPDIVKHQPNVDITPTPLQQAASGWQISDSPHLFILEDVTGAGKTEAAVLLAHRLMQAGLGSSLYFALPTMATANAMYERMGIAYRRLFSQESRPSLALAHGARDMSKAFRQSIVPEVPQTASDYGDKTVSAGAHCNAWLADNRKKALLADIGVGTIDQALLAILPSRHQSLRLFGLADNILIVDEVHACDNYMHPLLCALLEAHAVGGGSAILLSATLPDEHRQALLNTYSKVCHWEPATIQASGDDDFPLISCINAQGLSEVVVGTRQEVRREVRVEFLTDQESVEKLLAQAVSQGQCVCWIRNTVKDAIAAYQEISSRYPHWQVDLFHARFALADRIAIEKRVLDYFDKGSTADSRSGRVLIATQVVEQSLDIDFDLMITDLAPMDLILQRAGRLRRHTRDGSGNVIAGNDQRGEIVLHIHSPVVTETPDSDWYADYFPSAQKVYDHHGQLWLTAFLLHQRGGFRLPEDARLLIEGVYGAEAEDLIPEALCDRSTEATGKAKANTAHAKWQQLHLAKGYVTTAGQGWIDETKSVTRLGEQTTTVFLAKWQNGVLSPWSDESEYAWQYSAVSMLTYWIAREYPTEEIPEAIIEQCKQTLPAKGRWGVLLPLQQNAEGQWIGQARNEAGAVITFRYGEFGLLV